MATGGPYAWGLCYNKELSPDKYYCDEYYKLTYPCTPGAAYYGRGALPIFWYSYFENFSLFFFFNFYYHLIFTQYMIKH